MVDFDPEHINSGTHKDSEKPFMPLSFKAWELVGTSTEENHKVIKTNLQILSLACNFFTIGMCIYLLKNLANAIKMSKSNSQKRKI